MLCYRDYQLTTRFNQQNEKSTSNYPERHPFDCLEDNITVFINPRTFSLLQNMPTEDRQTFMLSEHFFRSENNLT